MSLTLGGRNPLAYIGVEPLQPPNLVVIERNPISGAVANADWRNFNVGTFWLNPINQTLWILVSKFSNIPFWLSLGIAPASLIEHFTTDTGGPVNPLAFNVNMFGDGNIITDNFTPNTVHFSLSPNLVLNSVTTNNLTVNNTTNLLGTINTNLPRGVVQSPGGGGALFSNEGVDGQVLISSSIGAPAWNTLTAGAGISIVNGHGTITVTNTGGGGGGALNTLTGNDGIPVTPTGNNIDIETAHATVKFLNSAPSVLSLDFLDAIDSNLVLGSSLIAFTSGQYNTGLGAGALFNIMGGSSNTAIGALAGQNITSGNQNTLIGTNCGGNLVTGSYNTLLGYGTGSAYNNAQSSNILIANTGNVADNNTIRIGNQGSGSGQQNRNFQAGIAGVIPPGTLNMVTIDTGTGQLGSQAIPGGTAGILITTYNTPGTYTFTKQSTSKELHIYGWHAGGGGASGSTRASAVAGLGGSGGGAGGGFYWNIPSSFVGATETVVVGTGGAGGAAVATINSGGNPGTAGTKTQFGSVISSLSGGVGGVWNVGQAAARPWFTLNIAQSIPGGDYPVNILQPLPRINTSILYASASGGMGAEGAFFPENATGSPGGSCSSFDGSIIYVAGGSGGVGIGAAGGNGNPQVISGGTITGGSGGGGGGSVNPTLPNSGAGGRGGNGGFPGGGGGGGGSASNGFSSGAGGTGGNGLIIIIEYY